LSLFFFVVVVCHVNVKIRHSLEKIDEVALRQGEETVQAKHHHIFGANYF